MGVAGDPKQSTGRFYGTKTRITGSGSFPDGYPLAQCAKHETVHVCV